MLIANVAEHGRVPHATFLRCPSEIPHRDANDLRASSVNGRRNSLSCIPGYHHTVIAKATPNGEFRKLRLADNNVGMASAKKSEIRRANLRRLLERDFSGNQSQLAEKLGNAPSLVNDLIKTGATKAFGEKLASRIEASTDLLDGQLDIPDSPLTKRSGTLDAERIIKSSLPDLSQGEKNEVAALVNEILGRRRRLRRA